MAGQAGQLRMGMAPGYDTPLQPSQVADYNAWRAKLPSDLQNSSDYDLQGAFLGGAMKTGRDHLTDQWKKPNHMTFSDGSIYSTADHPGGKWVGSDQSGWTFFPSSENLRQHDMATIADYFRTNEAPNPAEGYKGAFPLLPINYSLGRR